MSVKSLRAEAIPGLRLGGGGNPALRGPREETGMEKRARSARKNANVCTMPAALGTQNGNPRLKRRGGHLSSVVDLMIRRELEELRRMS
jgi:hypothetical protein